MADFLLSFLFSGGLISVIIIIAVIALFFNFVPLMDFGHCRRS